MSAALKKQKDLQEQVQRTFMHVVNDIIVTHIKLIGIAVLIIIVIVAGVMGWNSYTQKINERALTLEAEALKLFNEVSENAAAADDAAAESDGETADTPSKSWQDVLAAYQQIRDKYSGTKSAERALYLSASINYTMGNYAEAQRQFSTYLSKYQKGTLRYQAEESLGYIFEQQGEYQKALDTFQQLEPNVSASRKSALMLAIGRNYENLGQAEQAIATYQGIIDSNTSSDWKDMARERMDILQPAPIAAAEEPEEEAPSETTTSENENNS
jgi:TolA-binding protein